MDTSLTTSRIRAAWDHFKLSGDQPSGYGYGVEYDSPTELSTAESDTAGTYYDYATHGNHVAGIAGGSGAGTSYRGMAFECEFLFNSIQLDAGSAIDAFNWMKGIADEGLGGYYFQVKAQKEDHGEPQLVTEQCIMRVVWNRRRITGNHNICPEYRRLVWSPCGAGCILPLPTGDTVERCW